MKNNYDLIAIGDIVVDTFIKLEKANIHGVPDSENYEICMPFAEKVPYEDVFIAPAVGNAPNAAVAVSRLGIKAAIVSNIGDDRDGIDCLNSLKKDGVATEFIITNNGMKTNQHYVLWYGADRTILIKHEIYPYVLPEINHPKWIYFSSVNETAFPFHYTVADYLDSHPQVKLAFQPGKFEIKLGKDKLERLYKHSKIFVCNVEEAEKILGMEDTETRLDPSGQVKELLAKIRELGSETVIITDGPRGAYAYDGVEYLFMPAYPDPKPPYSRTGAGDAFSSTIVAGLIAGKTLVEALAWAGINSMSVVQQVGSQKGLLSREKLEEYLKNAPPEYKAGKL